MVVSVKELTYSQAEHRSRLKDLFTGVFIVTILVRVLRFLFLWLAGLASGRLSYYGSTALGVLAECLAVILPFLLMQRYRREKSLPLFREKARSRRPVLRTLLGCLAAAGLTLGLTGFTKNVLRLLESAGLHSKVALPDMGVTTPQTVFFLCLSVLLPAVCYEFAFRGVTVSALREENRLCAVLASALAFAFSDFDLYHILPRLAVGALLAAFYLRVHSLWACICVQAAALSGGYVWFLLRGDGPSRLFVMICALIAGIAATVFLFLPREEKEASLTPNRTALKYFFTSFGVYLLILLTAFQLLVSVFSTDADPDDPLLQPTPEQGAHPDFGKQEPLTFDRDRELGQDSNGE